MRHEPLRAMGSLGVRTAVALTLMVSLILAAGFAGPSWAALGDTAPSGSSDSPLLKAGPRVSTRATFTVHELQTSTGTVIREFIAPSGVVFAVSWRGPFKPSMSLVLGQYFGAYARAPRSPASTRSRLIIDQPNLIVHAAGHMRSFTGIAIAPQLLPANVAEQDLQ